MISLFLICVWYLTGSGYSWPGWVLAGWSIGLAPSAWEAYGRQPDYIADEEIQREIDRRRNAGQ